MEVAVEVRGIKKSFPGVIALQDINMKIAKGNVHAIVGENGAGKSTLMKILGGMYSPDSGEVFIHGQKVKLKSIRDSISQGISVIYQEFALMQDLSVAENIFVSDLPSIKGFVKKQKLISKTKELMDRLQIDLKPTALIKNLSVSQRQMVEILKAISQNARIIIMDEPTAALNQAEVEKLYEIIDKLKSENRTIIYISHRMKEIFDLADQVSVLRDGKYIRTEPISNLTHEKIVSMMVGREIKGHKMKSYSMNDNTLLSVRHLSRSGLFNDINFEVNKGEIIGISGLVGCGNVELAKALYGLIGTDTGEILLDGRKVKLRSSRDAINDGIAFLTDDRKESGIFSEMTVLENTSMNVLKKLRVFGPYIQKKKESSLLQQYTQFMKIKYANSGQKILHLSGGNQQKVLLARAISDNCKLLILLEPTRGVDIGAKAEIYQMLEELVKEGMTIVVVSSDLPELITICERILVMFQGEISGTVKGSEITENNIMKLATGNKITNGGESTDEIRGHLG